MKCLRCNGELEHLGHESLQLGQYGFFTGHQRSNVSHFYIFLCVLNFLIYIIF